MLSLLGRTDTLYAALQDESNPVSLLAAMAGWAQQAQTALFNLGDPVNADGSPVTSSEKGALPSTPLICCPRCSLHSALMCSPAALSSWTLQTPVPMI